MSTDSLRNRPMQSLIPQKTKNNKLSAFEEKFVAYYIKSGDGVWALKQAEYPLEDEGRLQAKARSLLNSPRIKQEIDKIMQEAHKEAIMNAQEVMEYFTSVVRGEIKDQFGLDAPLSERTRAAIELARRTVDIENREKLLNADQPVISIKLVRE